MISSRDFIRSLYLACMVLIAGAVTASAQVATPVASPIAALISTDLAAMTPDRESVPDDFPSVGEVYYSVDDLVAFNKDSITEDDLRVIGLSASYATYYFGYAEGTYLRAAVSEYRSIDGAKHGFALFEGKAFEPSDHFHDLPGLSGVGQQPSEISIGLVENEDGTQTRSYEVSFRIDRYLLSASLQTEDGSEPDPAVVEQFARDFAARVTAVLAGEVVEGVVPGLRELVIPLEGRLIMEGYQSGEDTFFLDDPATLPSGFVATYSRYVTLSVGPGREVPQVAVRVAQFASADAVVAALKTPDALMPDRRDLAELTTVRIPGADTVRAFGSFDLDDLDHPVHIRAYVQIGDKLLIVLASGFASITSANDAVGAIAGAQVRCLATNVCDIPVSIRK